MVATGIDNSSHCSMMSTRHFRGGNDGGCSSTVELRFVVPAVAGSNPVSHPFFKRLRRGTRVDSRVLKGCPENPLVNPFDETDCLAPVRSPKEPALDPRRSTLDRLLFERSSKRDVVLLDRRLGGGVAATAESASGRGLLAARRALGVFLLAPGMTATTSASASTGTGPE